MRNRCAERSFVRWLLHGLLVAVAVAAFPCVSVAGEPLEVLGQSELSVPARAGSNTTDAYVTLLNTTGSSIPIGVSFEAATAAAVSVRAVAPRTVVKDSAVRVKITFVGTQALSEKIEGVLVVTGGPLPVSRSTTITPAIQPSAPWATIIVIGAFVAMAVLAAGILGKASRDGELRKLGWRAPGPKWSFESWATTGTAVGALLGTVLGTETLPSVPRQLDKDTFVRLNLLFGALVLAGPFLFQTIRSKGLSPESEEGLWGYNWSLLLSCSVTCGAVLGEIATLALLGWEVIGGDAWSWIAVAVLSAAWLLAARYFAITAWELATTNWGSLKTSAPPSVALARTVRSSGASSSKRRLRPFKPVVAVSGSPRHWKLP